MFERTNSLKTGCILIPVQEAWNNTDIKAGKDTSKMEAYYKLEYKVLNLIDDGKADEAMCLLERKVQEGDTNALAIEGFLYIHGVGISRNVEFGKKKVEEAIEKGNKTALKFFNEKKL